MSVSKYNAPPGLAAGSVTNLFAFAQPGWFPVINCSSLHVLPASTEKRNNWVHVPPGLPFCQMSTALFPEAPTRILNGLVRPVSGFGPAIWIGSSQLAPPSVDFTKNTRLRGWLSQAMYTSDESVVPAVARFRLASLPSNPRK